MENLPRQKIFHSGTDSPDIYKNSWDCDKKYCGGATPELSLAIPHQPVSLVVEAAAGGEEVGGEESLLPCQTLLHYGVGYHRCLDCEDLEEKTEHGTFYHL